MSFVWSAKCTRGLVLIMDALLPLTAVGTGGGGKSGGDMEFECCCVTVALARGLIGVGGDHVSSAALDSIILREAEPPIVSPLPDFVESIFRSFEFPRSMTEVSGELVGDTLAG